MPSASLFPMPPLSEPDMDEAQETIYRLRFQVAFLEKKGTEFQDWFVRLAGYAFGSGFEAVRAYGKSGDFKCDGRRLSTRTIFQCYAPYQQTAAELDKKIDGDFRGAHDHWDTWMNERVLVHNDTRGLPPSPELERGLIRKAKSRFES